MGAYAAGAEPRAVVIGVGGAGVDAGAAVIGVVLQIGAERALARLALRQRGAQARRDAVPGRALRCLRAPPPHHHVIHINAIPMSREHMESTAIRRRGGLIQ